jgi:flagellar hook-basal body complex protein FliE
MAVNPVSGSSPIQDPRAAQPAAGGERATGKSDFGSMLQDVVRDVDRGQQNAADAMGQLVSGRSDDVVSVVAEVAQADMSFKLLVGVRNKIIEAYKQTMNMQI